jgi:hypothetical protein
MDGVASCLGKQASQGYRACPRSGADLQRQQTQGSQAHSQGIKQVGEGAGQLATSVPGMSSTGPVPTGVPDMAVGGATTILTNIN